MFLLTNSNSTTAFKKNTTTTNSLNANSFNNFTKITFKV